MICFHLAISLGAGNGVCSRCWRNIDAALVKDFRPIASVRLFYNFFALHDIAQNRAMLGQPPARRTTWFPCWTALGEHLLTATLFLDRTLPANIPVWILSLDLSKIFGRVNWGALWLALSEDGVSMPVLWIFQTLCFSQHGQVTGQRANSRTFQINAGVRQGCVVSQKMLSVFLHWAMSKWRTWAERCSFGFGLGDGSPPP